VGKSSNFQISQITTFIGVIQILKTLLLILRFSPAGMTGG